MADPKDPLAQGEAEQAPPVSSPQYLHNAVDQVRKDQEKEQVQVKTTEADAFARLSEMGEWQLLKEKLVSFVSTMRKAEATRMGTGTLDLQSIGLRSVVINEIADFAQRVITMVEMRHRRQIVDSNTADEDLPETSTPESYIPKEPVVE